MTGDGQSDDATPSDEHDAPARPPTLASLAKTARPDAPAAQPTRTPPAPAREAPSPRPTPPAPTRQGPPPPPPPTRGPASPAPAARVPDTNDGDDGGLERPWFAPPPAIDPTIDTTTPPTTAAAAPPVVAGPPPPPPAAPSPPTPAPAPPPTPAAPTPGAPAPPTPEAPRSANPPPAPPPPQERPDLTEILEQLHEDLDMEASPTPTQPGDALTDPRDLERPVDRDRIVVESTGGVDFQPTFASFGQRALGFVVDAVIVTAFVAPGIAVAVLGGSGAAVAAGVVLAVIGFVAAAAWYGRAVSSSGQWIGNRVADTRVVDVRNGRTVSGSDATARFAIRHLVSIVFFAGFLVALGDGQRRTFHDRFAGTVVVARERQTWSVDDEAS